jgi:hypothetical protein
VSGYPTVRLRRVAKTIWIFAWSLSVHKMDWANGNRKVAEGCKRWMNQIDQEKCYNESL